MISTVYLNPCIDQTIEIERFTYGGMNRVLALRKAPGGKSVNVSRILKRFGLDVSCAGILFKENGGEIQRQLEREGVHCDFLWRDGVVRVNTKLVDQSTMTTTEINEKGVLWNKNDAKEVKEVIRRNTAQSEYVVLTGSLPPSCPQEFYGSLIETCGREKCILDAEGEALTEGVKKAPLVVKCNRYELELAWDAKMADHMEIRKAAAKFLDMGAKFVIVTMGKEGMLALCEHETVFVPALHVPVVKTVGAGDAATAGLLYGITQRMGFHDMIRCAAAAAAASVAARDDVLFDFDSYKDYFDKIVLHES